MDELQRELDMLLAELAEMDRLRDEECPNVGLMTLARRGTKLAIAEVRTMMAKISSPA